MVKTLLVVCLATFLLSYVQFATLNDRYLMTSQLKRHADILGRQAGKPWQYRILPELIVEPFLKVFGICNGFKIAFVLFVLGAWVALLFYYKALGLSRNAGLLAISILACTFAYSTWDSSLPWSILLEIVFFALAGAFIIQGRYWWLLPLVLVATMNRETAGFIPLMLLLVAWKDYNIRKMAVICFIAFVIIFGGLRLWFPPQQQMGWYGGIMPFTWAHLKLNATSMFGWVRLWWFFGAIPLLVYLSLKRISPPLRRWVLWIVPIWCALNFCGAFIGEPNKYWTMQAVFLLPAVLGSIRNEIN